MNVNFKIESISGNSAAIVLDEDAKQKWVGKDKRVLCIINNSVEVHCAIMNSKMYGHFIMISKNTLKQLNCKIGDIVTIRFEKDTSEIQFKESDILNEVLNTDENASLIYQKLTNGNKRGLHAMVSRIKNEQKQIDTALLIADKLKQGITQPIKILKK